MSRDSISTFFSPQRQYQALLLGVLGLLIPYFLGGELYSFIYYNSWVRPFIIAEFSLLVTSFFFLLHSLDLFNSKKERMNDEFKKRMLALIIICNLFVFPFIAQRYIKDQYTNYALTSLSSYKTYKEKIIKPISGATIIDYLTGKIVIKLLPDEKKRERLITNLKQPFPGKITQRNQHLLLDLCFYTAYSETLFCYFIVPAFVIAVASWLFSLQEARQGSNTGLDMSLLRELFYIIVFVSSGLLIYQFIPSPDTSAALTPLLLMTICLIILLAFFAILFPSKFSDLVLQIIEFVKKIWTKLF